MCGWVHVVRMRQAFTRWFCVFERSQRGDAMVLSLQPAFQLFARPAVCGSHPRAPALPLHDAPADAQVGGWH